MNRRRILPIVVLVMLFASLFSTETAEVWCRVAVGATMNADDDDSPYFACRPLVDANQSQHTNSDLTAEKPSIEHSSISAALNDGAVVDEPTFILPQFWIAIVPCIFFRISFPLQTVNYSAETRGPPVQSDRLAYLSTRGPPAS